MSKFSPKLVTLGTQKTFCARRKPSNSIFSRPIYFPCPGSQFRVRARRSSFEDFQGYAKPSHLMHTMKVDVSTENSIEKIRQSLNGDETQCIFKVDISTSKLFGSNLSDLNAGVLLCLIDEKGNSILQRIPSSLMAGLSTEKDILDDPEILSFQRGSCDEFIFKGPKLGRLEAIWLGVESGQWRVGSLSLIIISWLQPSIEKSDGEENRYMGIKFEFPAEDILLGEGSDKSMVELRPCLVSELSGVEPFSILKESSFHSNSANIDITSNEKSMKEYTDLKLSLLLYDALLIFIGSSVASIADGEDVVLPFLAGGVIGFLYLLVLQRSVDELPAPTSISETSGDEDQNQTFRSYKGPLSTLAIGIGFFILIVKYKLGDSAMNLTSKEIVMGMMGFLACKVSVVLAAIKPLQLSQNVNE